MTYTNDEYIKSKIESLSKALTHFEYKHLDKLSKDIICNYTIVTTFGYVHDRELVRPMFEAYQAFYKKLFNIALTKAQQYLGPIVKEPLHWGDGTRVIADIHVDVDILMGYVHGLLVGMKPYRKYMNKGKPSSIDRKDIKGIIGEKQLSIFTQFNLKTTDNRNFYLEARSALVETKFDETHPEKFVPVQVIEIIFPDETKTDLLNDISKENGDASHGH